MMHGTTAKRTYFVIDKKGIVRFKGIMQTTEPTAPIRYARPYWSVDYTPVTRTKERGG